jgi:ubiquinone/menaquinone biosynthesis C-methylase UbiE
MTDGAPHRDTSRPRRFFSSVAPVYAALDRRVPAEYLDAIISSFVLSRGSRIIELGCGTGELATALAHSSLDVTALDASPAMIRLARSGEHASSSLVRWISEPVEAFDFGANNYDAVFSLEAFHLFPNREDLLTRIAAGLSPDGTFGVGWRIASWETELKPVIISTFERYSVSLHDWEYSRCHDLSILLANNGMFDPITERSIFVDSRIAIEDAARFLVSIGRTASLTEAARTSLKEELINRIGERVDGDLLVGQTEFGFKCAHKRSDNRRRRS